MLGKIACLMPTGSVEKERTSSLMNCLKDARRNLMGAPLLNALTRTVRSRYKVDTFPYREVLKKWREAAERRGTTL